MTEIFNKNLYFRFGSLWTCSLYQVLESLFNRLTLSVIFIAILLGTAQSVSAAIYYSRASGNWNGAVWSTTTTGAANTATILSTDNVVIQSGNTITTTEVAVCNTLSLSTSTSVLNVGAYNFTVYGTTSITGTLNITGYNGTKIFTGLVTVNSGGVWNNSGNSPVTFRGGITNNGTFTRTANQYTFDTNSQSLSGTIDLSGSAVAITGITLTNAGTLTLSSNLSGTGTLKNTSVLNLSSYTTLSALTNQGTLNITGNNTISTALANFTNTGTINLNGINYITGITNNAAGIVNFINPTQTIGTLNNAAATSVLNISALITSASAINTLTATTAGNTVKYSGSGDQTIKNTTYSNLIIDGGGTKTLSGPVTVTATLTLTNGILSTTTNNLLTITNTSATAIAGGSAAAYVDGPLKWTFSASLTSSTSYFFPVGSGSVYLPFTLVNPKTSTGTVYAQVQAFNSASGGVAGTDLIGLSTSEYWKLSTSGFTSSAFTLGKSTDVNPLNVLASSTTQSGTYNNLNGTATTYSVSNSDVLTIGTTAQDRYLVLAAKLNAIQPQTSVFWLKADAGTSTTTNGAGVNTWTGQSTTANNGTSQATAPVYASTLWNFNPGINFTAGYFLLNRGALQDDMTFYTVYNSTQSASSSSWWTMPSIIGNEANGTGNDFGLGQNAGKFFFKATSGDNYLQTSSTYNDGYPRVVAATRKKTSSTANNLFIYINGTQTSAGTSDNTSLSDYGYIGIGRTPTESSSQFVGGISEVIGKNYLTTFSERHVYETYLALKYGITLAHDYKKATSGADSVIYVISGYTNDIAGLGRNNIFGLNQKVSSSVNVASGSAHVVMATDNDFSSSNLTSSRTALTDGQYLIWGHNGGTVNSWTTISGTKYSKVNRVWRVQNTSSVGSVYFQIDLSGFASLPASGSYALLVGNESFSTISSIYPLTNSSGNLYWANPQFPSGTYYFTIVSVANYWMGTSSSTDWGTASNWTANFIPATGQDVEFATVANYGTTALNDLVLDTDRQIKNFTNKTDKKLIIPTNKALSVTGTISTNNDPSQILIKSSSSDPNGSFIFTTTSPVYATVEMYSKSSINTALPDNSRSKYFWQFMGIPLKSIVANPTLAGAYVREMLEYETDTATHWRSLNNSSVLTSFKGYELCQPSPQTYYFSGQLENSDYASGQLAVTSGALYPGQHLLANPYAAAIDVTKISFGTGMDNTVYLYNTGTFSQWNSNVPAQDGTAPGQYVSIPVLNAGTAGIPKEVLSMSSMLVRATSSVNAGVSITYNNVIKRNTVLQRAPEVKRVLAATSTTDVPLLLIAVEGENTRDRLWLIERENCTDGFDNGYDGLKYEGTAMQSSISSVTPDGRYQVNTTNSIDNAVIDFKAGVDKEYKLKIINYNLSSVYQTLYLYDKAENILVDIMADSTEYRFNALNTSRAENRFRIIARTGKSSTGTNNNVVVYTDNENICVKNIAGKPAQVNIYDAVGRMITTRKLAADELFTLPVHLYVPYIVTAETENGFSADKILVR